jgi:hypothetical protein
MMAASGNDRFQTLVDSLSVPLGRERSLEVVRATVQEIGANEQSLSEDDVRNVLDMLGRRGGIVGVAARVAQRPLTRATTETRLPLKGVGRDSLVMMIAPAVGEATAREAIERFTAQMGIVQSPMTIEQASRVLEAMAQVEGILGTVARFAKVRLLLRRRR